MLLMLPKLKLQPIAQPSQPQPRPPQQQPRQLLQTLLAPRPQPLLLKLPTSH